MKDVMLLLISIRDSSPLISRLLFVKSAISFTELHHTIQIAMEWDSERAFEFNVEGYRIGLGSDDSFTRNPVLDASTTRLRDLISEVEELFEYDYELDETWLIDVYVIDIVDKLLPDDHYPLCLDGEQASPPVSCMGIYHYYALLDILETDKTDGYKITRDWIPRNFDPDAFDPDKVNKKLGKLASFIKKKRKRGR